MAIGTMAPTCALACFVGRMRHALADLVRLQTHRPDGDFCTWLGGIGVFGLWADEGVRAPLRHEFFAPWCLGV